MVDIVDIAKFLGINTSIRNVSVVSSPWNIAESKGINITFSNNIEFNTKAGIVICPQKGMKPVFSESIIIPTKNPKLDFVKVCREFFPTVKAEIKFGYDVIRKEFTAIGGEGFGYVGDNHFPHYGNVIIGHGVHIGSFTCIDRGSLSHTIIGNQVKIDNHVHIAHNVKVGNGTKIIAGVVICGSAIIGENCFIGAKSTILQGIKVGNNVTIGAGAVVTKNVPDGETWIGVPAKKK